jgi:hypothetical protein
MRGIEPNKFSTYYYSTGNPPCYTYGPIPWGMGRGRTLTPLEGKRDVLEVVLSLNGVFGKPTGSESMTESGRVKFG